MLLAAEGLENKPIAQQMGITPEKAARWRNRYLEGGIAGAGEGCSAAGQNTHHHGGPREERGGDDAASEAGPRHALEHTYDGGGRHQRV